MRRYADIQNTRNAFIASVVVGVVCILVFAGMSFAWFTSSALNGANQVRAGSIAVQLTGEGAESAVLDPEPLSLNSAWRPGERYRAALTVSNAGNLDLTYQLSAWVAPLEADVAPQGSSPHVSAGMHLLADASFAPATASGEASGSAAAFDCAAARQLATGRHEELRLEFALTDGICNALKGKSAQVVVCAVAQQAGAGTPSREPIVSQGEAYRIVSSADDLAWIADQAQRGADFSHTTFALCEDVIVPAGLTIGSAEKPFAGIFDGCGNTVSVQGAAGEAPAPLFGSLANGAAVRNLMLAVSGGGLVQKGLGSAVLVGRVANGAAVAISDVAICFKGFALTVAGEASSSADILLAVGALGPGAMVAASQMRMLGTVAAPAVSGADGALSLFASDAGAGAIAADGFCYVAVSMS